MSSSESWSPAKSQGSHADDDDEVEDHQRQQEDDEEEEHECDEEQQADAVPAPKSKRKRTKLKWELVQRWDEQSAAVDAELLATVKDINDAAGLDKFSSHIDRTDGLGVLTFHSRWLSGKGFIDNKSYACPLAYRCNCKFRFGISTDNSGVKLFVVDKHNAASQADGMCDQHPGAYALCEKEFKVTKQVCKTHVSGPILCFYHLNLLLILFLCSHPEEEWQAEVPFQTSRNSRGMVQLILARCRHRIRRCWTYCLSLGYARTTSQMQRIGSRSFGRVISTVGGIGRVGRIWRGWSP